MVAELDLCLWWRSIWRPQSKKAETVMLVSELRIICIISIETHSVGLSLSDSEFFPIQVRILFTSSAASYFSSIGHLHLKNSCLYDSLLWLLWSMYFYLNWTIIYTKSIQKWYNGMQFKKDICNCFSPWRKMLFLVA